MKTIQYLILTVLIAATCGCKDFLDTEPISFTTPENIRNQNDLSNALNGAYRILIYQKGDRLQPLSTDFMSDDAICNDLNYGELLIWMGQQAPDDEKCVLDKWDRDYRGILRANTVISKAPDIEMDESERNRYVAEAKFLRAYFYADLIEFFGDVPYRTEPEGLEQKISPRVDKNTIMLNILLDLEEAANILPVEYSNPLDYGRATKGAAYALKARISLYNHHYNWAAEECRKVIDLNKYNLHPSYKELFTVTVEKTNKEYIFVQQYIKDKSQEGLSGAFWTKLSAFGAYQMAHNLVEDYYMKATGLRYDAPGSGYSNRTPFTGRDPRLLYTIKTEYGDLTGTSHTGYKVQKFVDDAANPNNIHRNDEIDYPLIRYADILLMLAESLVESGNYDYNEVTSLVDRVRQRGDVMMPKIADVEGAGGRTLSQDELREVIRHERRVEFPLEGLRYSDIRRWKIGPKAFTDCYALVKRTADEVPAYTYYDKVIFMRRTFNASKGYLWPIPVIEIQTNPMLNNPGYVGGPGMPGA